MGLIDFSDFSLWQKRLLDFFWNNKEKDNSFLEKLSVNHPNFRDNTEADADIEASILSRMKNYGRKKKRTDGVTEYSRCPYLDDLYALCASKQITPNDILFDSINCEIESLSLYEDIFYLIQRIPAGKVVINLFSISKDDFSNIRIRLPHEGNFRLLFINRIVSDFIKAFEFTEMLHTKPHIEFNVYPDDDDYDLLCDTVKLIGINNGATIDYILAHPDFYESLYSGHWKYEIASKKSDNKFISPIYGQKYALWSHKKQFLVSLNYYLLVTAIKSLRESFLLYTPLDDSIDIRSASLEAIKTEPDLRTFLQQLFANCFIKINQMTAINWSGQVYCEDDFEEQKNHVEAHYEKPATDSGRSLNDILGSITNK